MTRILIVAPSLETSKNVSGISAVTNFIIANNKSHVYKHFLQGKGDDEKSNLSRIVRLIRNFQKWRKLLDHLDDYIIHYNFPLDTFSIIRDYFFIKAARNRKKKIIIHIHGGLYLFKENKPILIKRILNIVFNWNYPSIVLSKKEKEQIINEYHTENIYVLPNCIDLSIASNFYREYNKNTLDILYLGRIEPNKGIDYIYDAVKILHEKKIVFTLHFAGTEQGNHNYIEKFSQLLGKTFIYEGIVTGQKKDRLLEQCQILLLPSFYEGLPIALLECMSFGMIPVTTNVGSMGDFVIDNKTGLLVKLKDADSIVKALSILYDSPELRFRLSQEARKMIFSTMDPQWYIKELNRIYQFSYSPPKS